MKRILYLWVAALLLTSCASAEIQVDTNNLAERYGENAIVEASGDITLVFTDTESSKTVKFTSNKPWSAEFEGQAPDWLSFTPTSGEEKEVQMKISVTQNGYDGRRASLRITSEDKSVRFTIEQKQKDALTVTQSSFEVSGDGGEIQIEVKSNIDYTCTVSSNAESWVKRLDTKGLSTRILKFQILPTDVQKERVATIRIGAPNRTAETITVTQGPKYYLDAPTSCSVADSRSEFIVSFKTNAKIVAKCEDNWIRPVSNYSGNKSLKFSVTENPGLSARRGSITLKSDDDLISATVKVVQEDTLFHRNNLGIFEINGHKSSQLRPYRSGSDQDVLMENAFTFQNYENEDYFSLVYEKNFQNGGSQDVRVMAFGISGVLSHKGRVKVTQMTQQGIWLYDEGASLVYVIKPTQE